MKYRRKPIDRSIVDALDANENFLVKREPNGEIETIAREDFLRDYEPVLRSPSTKPKKARKRRGEATTA